MQYMHNAILYMPLLLKGSRHMAEVIDLYVAIPFSTKNIEYITNKN